MAYGPLEDWILSVAFSGNTISIKDYIDGTVSLRSREALVEDVEKAQRALEEVEALIGTTLPADSTQRQELARAEDALYAFDAEATEDGIPSVINRAQYEQLDVAGRIKALRAIVSEVVIAPGGKQGGAANPGARVVVKFHDGRQHPPIWDSASVPPIAVEVAAATG